MHSVTGEKKNTIIILSAVMVFMPSFEISEPFSTFRPIKDGGKGFGSPHVLVEDEFRWVRSRNWQAVFFHMFQNCVEVTTSYIWCHEVHRPTELMSSKINDRDNNTNRGLLPANTKKIE
jgi:hypothetical protein